jgi:hypothetical protein
LLIASFFGHNLVSKDLASALLSLIDSSLLWSHHYLFGCTALLQCKASRFYCWCQTSHLLIDQCFLLWSHYCFCCCSEELLDYELTTYWL